jgi:hypothetical protein
MERKTAAVAAVEIEEKTAHIYENPFSREGVEVSE